MFGKMMNSYYYGKSGKGDYRKEDLPQNRWQLFWEMLKIRLSGLCRLNLMYAVVWIPALLVVLSAASDWVSISFYTLEQQDLLQQGALTADAYAQAVIGLDDATNALILRTLIFLIPCIAITGPFTAGAAFVTRNWARDEHAFIWSDFRDAVKENWKQGLVISGITAVMPTIFYVCWMFYGQMTDENVFFVVPQTLSIMLVALWLCSLLYMYPLMVTYKLRLRDLFRNGLLLAVGRLPATVGLKLLSLLPVLITAIIAIFGGVGWAFLFAALYYIVIGFSLSRFVGASYANAVFDRFINPNIEGAEVNRGLYTDEDEEDEYGEAADAE